MSSSTLIVIDARSREQNVFTASATILPGKPGMVLRRGVDVGSIDVLHGQTLEYPILVVGSYQAQSSAGFTTPLYSGAVFQRVLWIGGVGFPKGLRPFGNPVEGVLIPAGAVVEEVETPANSNAWTANAAFTGLRLRTQINQHLFILAEGQSDWVKAVSFTVPEDAEVHEFPEEHRADIFSSEKVLDAAMHCLARGDVGRKNLMYAVLRAACRVGCPAPFVDISPAIREILGNEEINRVVEERVAALEAEGWRFGFDMSLANRFTCGYSPEGDETTWNAIGDDAFVEEQFLRDATSMHEDGFLGRAYFRNARISDIVGGYFWGWDCRNNFGTHETLVEGWFGDDTEPERLWYCHDEGRLGPNSEPSQGYRYLNAWDSWSDQQHFWPRLSEMSRARVTVYDANGPVDSIEWLAAECKSPYVNHYESTATAAEDEYVEVVEE
jgi:hypothetical protein